MIHAAMIAAVAFTAVMALRILASAAQLVDHVIDPEELENFTLPPPSHSFDNWTDWETWEASPEIAKLLPYQRSGCDYDGLVVYLVDFGKWSFRAVAQLSPDGGKEFWKHYEQLVRREERDAAMCNDQGMVFLLDWEGFSLNNYASSTALKESLKMFASFVGLNNHVKYGFFVNVDFSAETFINIARPFMGTFLDKFEIYGTHGTKWKPRVLRSIPPGQLPPKYGGLEGWKPLPLN